MKLELLGRRLTVEIGRAGATLPDLEARIRTAAQPWAGVDIREQALLKDDSVYAVYNLLTDVALGGGWRWVGDDADKVTELTDAITAARGWTDLLDSIAGATFTRYAVAEIVWRHEARAWLPAAYRTIPQDAASLDLDEYGEVAKIEVRTTAGLQPLPPENAIVHRNHPTFDKPLGRSAFDNLEEIIQYKRRADLALLKYIERFAVPTIVGYYAPGTDRAKQTDLLTALKALQAAAVGVLPGPKGEAGNSIDLLEAHSSAAITTAVDMLRMYERRIARGVLGSVLAIFESEFGTRAQADTHLSILQSVVASYQGDIEGTINEQLVQPVMAYNIGRDVDCRFELIAPDFADRAVTGRWVTDLAAAGIIDAETDGDAIRALFGLEPRTDEQIALLEERRAQEEEAAAARAQAAAAALQQPDAPAQEGAQA